MSSIFLISTPQQCPTVVRPIAQYNQANSKMCYPLGYYQIRGKGEIDTHNLMVNINALVFKTQNLGPQKVCDFKRRLSLKIYFCRSVTLGSPCLPASCRYSHSVEEKYAYNLFFNRAYKGRACLELFNQGECRAGIECVNVHPGELMIHTGVDGRLHFYLYKEAQNPFQSIAPSVEKPCEQTRSWSPWEGKEIVGQAARDLLVASIQKNSQTAPSTPSFTYAFLEPIEDSPSPQTPGASPGNVDRVNRKRSPLSSRVFSFSPPSFVSMVEVEEPEQPAYFPSDQTRVVRREMPSSTRSPAFQMRRTLSLGSIAE